jgi:hypothetical protein
MRRATLGIEWVTRVSARSYRYLDLIIDGVPLRHRFGTGDVSPFTHVEDDPLHLYVHDGQDLAIDRFLGVEPPDLPGGRTSLYTCGECGDLECGAWSVIIEHAGDTVVWCDIGRQKDDHVRLWRDSEGCLPPYTFDAAAYRAFFEALRPRVRLAARES